MFFRPVFLLVYKNLLTNNHWYPTETLLVFFTFFSHMVFIWSDTHHIHMLYILLSYQVVVPIVWSDLISRPQVYSFWVFLVSIQPWFIFSILVSYRNSVIQDTALAPQRYKWGLRVQLLRWDLTTSKKANVKFKSPNFEQQ